MGHSERVSVITGYSVLIDQYSVFKHTYIRTRSASAAGRRSSDGRTSFDLNLISSLNTLTLKYFDRRRNDDDVKTLNGR